jgi:apolipoprotein N-acyltransferase
MAWWPPLIAALCLGSGPAEGPWAVVGCVVGLVAWAATPVGRPVRDLAVGAAVGLVWYGVSLSWFLQTWTGFQSVGNPWLAWLGLTLCQATVPALASGLSGLLLAAGWRRSAAIPVGWVAAEGVAATLQPLPGGLTLYMAHVQPLLWPASWGGVPGWLAVAGLAAGLTLDRRRSAAFVWGSWALIGLIPASYAIDGAPVTVALVQPNAGALEARQPSRAEDLAREIRQTVDRVQNAEIVVAAEGAWPLDPGPEGSFRRRSMQEVWKGTPPTVIGMTIQDGPLPTNSVIGLVDGVAVGRVDKVYLLPLGEREVFGFGKDAFRPGEAGARVIPVGPVQLGVLLCYEDLLGGALRDLGQSDLVLTATNDTWLGPGAGSRAHEAGSRLAAVRAGRWMVRPTLAGRSLVVDPTGHVAVRGPWVDGDLPGAPGPWTTLATVRARTPPWWTGAEAEPWLYAVAWISLAYAALQGLFSRRSAGEDSRY